jgi:uncharacterized CHY-type Zn-finger protein
MTDVKVSKSKRTDKHVDVTWQTPSTRAQPVFRHEVTCAHCGREFVIEESLQPVSPKFCLEADNPQCFRDRRAAYMKAYRANHQKGETQKE